MICIGSGEQALLKVQQGVYRRDLRIPLLFKLVGVRSSHAFGRLYETQINPIDLRVRHNLAGDRGLACRTRVWLWKRIDSPASTVNLSPTLAQFFHMQVTRQSHVQPSLSRSEYVCVRERFPHTHSLRLVRVPRRTVHGEFVPHTREIQRLRWESEFDVVVGKGASDRQQHRLLGVHVLVIVR